MIALASRLEFIMMDTDLGDQTGMWFWEMIENLDLDEFSDTTYNQAEVARRLDILLDRMYSPEGYGGLFPMCPCPADFTKTEIWQQAMYYLDRKAYGSTKEAF